MIPLVEWDCIRKWWRQMVGVCLTESELIDSEMFAECFPSLYSQPITWGLVSQDTVGPPITYLMSPIQIWTICPFFSASVTTFDWFNREELDFKSNFLSQEETGIQFPFLWKAESELVWSDLWFHMLWKNDKERDKNVHDLKLYITEEPCTMRFWRGKAILKHSPASDIPYPLML